MVLAVGDNQRASDVNGDSGRVVQLGRIGGPSIAGESPQSGVPCAGESANCSRRADQAYTVIVGVGDVEITVWVDGDAARIIELSLSGRASVAGEPAVANPDDTGASDRCDRSVGRDPADSIVSDVGEEDTSGAIDGDSAGP